MQSDRLLETILIVIILSVSLERARLTVDFSPLGSITIQNTGNVEISVMARSGSANDIQEAVDLMASIGGGEVHVPGGTFHWGDETVTIPGGVSVIGAGSSATILHQDIYNPPNNKRMFLVDAGNGKPGRISGIRFEGTVNNSNDNVNGMAIELWKAMDWRVDHCVFIDFANEAVLWVNVWTGTTRGVVDHCTFDNPYKDIYGGVWGYGVGAIGEYPNWDTDISHFLGKYETAPRGFPIIYIEDCHFSRCRHAIASNQGAWYVARYNIIDNERPENFGSIDVHGSGGSTIAPGGRGLEAYNNTIIATSGYIGAQPFWVRGGGGVIFNNTLQNPYYGIGIFNEDPNNYLPYSKVRDLYIWGNTLNSGTLLNNAGGYVENVNYFLSAPANYTPYPYPHPMTLVP